MKRHAIVKYDALEVDGGSVVWTEGSGKEMPFKHLTWLHYELGSGGDATLEQIADPYNCHPRSCLRDI